MPPRPSPGEGRIVDAINRSGDRISRLSVAARARLALRGAVRLVQQMLYVGHFHSVASSPQPSPNLHCAARVRGDDYISAGRDDAVKLGLENLHRQLVVRQVVNSGA